MSGNTRKLKIARIAEVKIGEAKKDARNWGVRVMALQLGAVFDTLSLDNLYNCRQDLSGEGILADSCLELQQLPLYLLLDSVWKGRIFHGRILAD